MSPEAEAQRRRALRNHKAYATGLLVVAALIFLLCSWWQSRAGGAPPWVGWVRAGAEAGMIGGLADWFAVTALFRRPMGLPIPHTALVPAKKDQLGDALSEFVGDNFLNPQLITEKVSQAEVPELIGRWLSGPDNAALVSREVGKFTVNAVQAVDPADAEELINRQVIDRLAEPEWAPHAGRMLEGLIEDGKTEPVVDAVITWARERIGGAEESIVSMIDERMPQWAPRFARDLVGERVYREVVSFLADVDNDPEHDARRSIRRFITQLAVDLQEDPAMIARVESIKADIMDSRAMRGAGAQIWQALSTALIDAASDESSTLRAKVRELCVSWGQRIQSDAELRASLDRRINGAVKFLAENYSGEVTAIISETISRWDAREASDKIELMVGKDLTYIRLNGTIVGALAGVVIYTVNQLLFGG